ncbi:hypothetical protein CLG96_00495 [Sphingomonas oleivorans]|uniref:Uncharacterized protein n=1 Tax=Sphingomonas oleivorans TaxID=1735121 RepID=A0A2T5G0M5_9SPHN|nr:hypothetical protein [Sphingomonas oleivorans]PTQ12683.1 hypothetical protein CLG96_00495 [Sphingomonas oleivorans]
MIQTSIAEPMLSKLEWKVISLAFNEATECGCGSFEEPSRLGGAVRRAFNWITGIEPSRPLADPKLESLRRFACETRRHGRPAKDLAPALIEHGFSAGQVQAVALLSTH